MFLADEIFRIKCSFCDDSRCKFLNILILIHMESRGDLDQVTKNSTRKFSGSLH